AILDLIEELFAPPGPHPPYYTRERGRDGVRHCVESPNADCLLAEEDSVALGLATVYIDLLSIRRGQRCTLEELVVTGEQRSRGVGALLLEAARGWAREHGCAHLQLESGLGRKDAHRFYLTHDMDQVSYVFTRDV
ncbi:MAG: GNAT family N-acetyltransferase, partial [Dehalococcoidia bacterium]